MRHMTHKACLIVLVNFLFTIRAVFLVYRYRTRKALACMVSCQVMGEVYRTDIADTYYAKEVQELFVVGSFTEGAVFMT